MNSSRRLQIGFFFLSLALLVGTVFWPFVLDNIITPGSLVIWLLLRISILSIGQLYYWYALILVLLICLFRLLAQDQSAPEAEMFRGTNATSATNATIRSVEYWHSMLTLNDHHSDDIHNLRWKLVCLLLSLYATKQRTEADLRLHEALARGEIPLPKEILAFLFPDVPRETGRSFLKRVWLSWSAAAKRMRRRLERNARDERYRMIDDVLAFMEESLEINNDARTAEKSKH